MDRNEWTTEKINKRAKYREVGGEKGRAEQSKAVECEKKLVNYTYLETMWRQVFEETGHAQTYRTRTIVAATTSISSMSCDVCAVCFA